MISRYPDWQPRLEAFLAANQSRPFHYGTWDCCLFVCDAIRAMNGVDPSTGLRGQYASKPEAAEAIARKFGKPFLINEVIEGITLAHRMPACKVPHLQRGDVALIKRWRDVSLGLVSLDGTQIIVVGTGGLQRIPLSRAARGWHV
jgi:hypothetical protein